MRSSLGGLFDSCGYSVNCYHCLPVDIVFVLSQDITELPALVQTDEYIVYSCSIVT